MFVIIIYFILVVSFVVKNIFNLVFRERIYWVININDKDKGFVGESGIF